MEKLENMYRALGEKVDERYQETSLDYDSWTSVHNTLQQHIGSIGDMFSKYDKEQSENIQKQIEEQNKKYGDLFKQQNDKNNQLKEEITSLKSKLDKMSNENDDSSNKQHEDFNDFLNKLEELNKKQKENWNKSKQHSQNEIQRVLDMLKDPPPQNDSNHDEEILNLQNEIERLKEEQNLAKEHNEKSIESLRSVIEKQKKNNAAKDLEIESLKKTISASLKSEDAIIDKLQKDLMASKEEKKRENERLKTYQNEIFALRQELEKSQKKNKQMIMFHESEKLKNAKMEELNQQNEDLKEINLKFQANIDALKEEMNAVQNELNKNKNKANKELMNNDRVIEKLQDVLQVLYRELKPNKDNFDDPKEISNAFKEWKQRERIKYQNMLNKESDDDNSSEYKRDTDEQYDVANTSCQQYALLNSFFRYFKDF